MDNWKGAKEGGGQAEKAKGLYKGDAGVWYMCKLHYILVL